MALLPVHMCIYRSKLPDDTVLLCGATAGYHGPANVGNSFIPKLFLEDYNLHDYEEWCKECQDHPDLGLHMLAAMELE